MSDSLRPHGLQPTRIFSPWDFPGKNTGVACHYTWGFPGGISDKEPACKCRRCKRFGFHPWLGKIPCRRAWQPTLGFLPGESHGQRSLPGYRVHRLGRSQTQLKQLSRYTCILYIHVLYIIYLI